MISQFIYFPVFKGFSGVFVGFLRGFRVVSRVLLLPVKREKLHLRYFKCGFWVRSANPHPPGHFFFRNFVLIHEHLGGGAIAFRWVFLFYPLMGLREGFNTTVYAAAVSSSARFPFACPNFPAALPVGGKRGISFEGYRDHRKLLPPRCVG